MVPDGSDHRIHTAVAPGASTLLTVNDKAPQPAMRRATDDSMDGANVLALRGGETRPLREAQATLLVDHNGTVGPAADWAQARTGDGTARPDDLPDGDAHLQIERTFCFVDLAGFTAYTHAHGPEASVRLLGDFRRLTRNIAAKRGVRVAKWLGDGAMLVGTTPEPVAALAVDLVYRFSMTDLDVRVGLATGTALLFEGDDYIGEPVNLAARLCATADPGEVLADIDIAILPDWVSAEHAGQVEIRGIGVLGGIRRLTPAL
jgi:adenylate cyclase